MIILIRKSHCPNIIFRKCNQPHYRLIRIECCTPCYSVPVQNKIRIRIESKRPNIIGCNRNHAAHISRDRFGNDVPCAAVPMQKVLASCCPHIVLTERLHSKEISRFRRISGTPYQLARAVGKRACSDMNEKVVIVAQKKKGQQGERTDQLSDIHKVNEQNGQLCRVRNSTM